MTDTVLTRGEQLVLAQADLAREEALLKRILEDKAKPADDRVYVMGTHGHRRWCVRAAGSDKEFPRTWTTRSDAVGMALRNVEVAEEGCRERIRELQETLVTLRFGGAQPPCDATAETEIAEVRQAMREVLLRARRGTFVQDADARMIFVAIVDLLQPLVGEETSDGA